MIRSLSAWAYDKLAHARESSSIGARFARGTFWSLLGTLIVQGLSMTASIIAARLVGAEGFGEFGMVNSTVGSFGVFAGLGLGLTATRHIAEYRSSDPARAGRILKLSTHVAIVAGSSISLLLFLIAPWLATNTLNAPHLVSELRLGCLLLFFNSLTGLQTGALAGLESFRSITTVNFLRGLLNFPTVIVGTWLFGLTGMVVATVITSAAGWGLSQRALRQECAHAGIITTNQKARAELPVLWRFALPAFLSGVVSGPSLWLANTLVANQPGGYRELGIVNAANQWRNALVLLPSVFNSVLLPMLSSSQEDEAAFRRAMETAQSIAMMVIMPVATVLLFLGKWVMTLYGKDFATGGAIFVSLLTGAAVSGIASASGPAIQATGQMWLGALMNLTWGLVLVLFTGAFVSRFGGTALALGSALAYVSLTGWGYAYLVSRNVIGREMMTRVFIGVLFLVVVAVFAQITPRHLLLLSLAPALLLSLWLGTWVLSPPFLRQRLASIVLRSLKHDS